MKISTFLSLMALFFVFGTPAFSDAQWSSEEEAQKIAEQLVYADCNQDKTIALAPGKSVEIVASIVGLKPPHVLDINGQEASIEDLYANLDDSSANIEDSLARLNADVTDSEVRINLQAAVLFAFDKSELRPDAMQRLTDVLTVLNAYPSFPVLIEGYTCSIGSDEYNQKLSLRRATAVTDWLRQHSITSKRLTVTGHGEKNPIANNNEEDGRIQNRRVEIVMKKVSEH